MGIDPGTTTFGVGFIDANEELTIQSVFADTVLPQHEYSQSLYSPVPREGLNAFERTRLICGVVDRFINYYSPDIVCIETPFINMRMPKSFVILSQHFNDIKSEVARHHLPILDLSPQTIKKGMGVAGKKGKDPMLASFKANPELMGNLTADVSSLSEHAIDAVSAAYCLITKMRSGEF